MAKSTAERQAAYRARRAGGGVDGNGERKLSVWVSAETALALGRLARHEALTQRAIIERLILADDERHLAAIASDSAEWDAYFGVKTLLMSAAQQAGES